MKPIERCDGLLARIRGMNAAVDYLDSKAQERYARAVRRVTFLAVVLTGAGLILIAFCLGGI